MSHHNHPNLVSHEHPHPNLNITAAAGHQENHNLDHSVRS